MSKKNQLFKKIPPLDIVIKVIKTFGFQNFDDKRSFTRKDLLDFETVNKLYELKTDLIKYYLPCKARTYLNSLTEKNSITVLRQCIKVYGYTVSSREKYFKGEKFIIYNICPVKETEYFPMTENYLKKQHENIVLSFD